MGWSAALGRAVFCVTVALTAAALASPLVEHLSDSGVFGSGVLTDRSSADVLPALFVSVVCAGAFVVGLARRLACPSAPAPGWLCRAAAVTRLNFSQTLFAYAMQIAVLFGMETCEQMTVWGHPLGGTIWLGGPVAVSLAIHAAFGITIAALFSRTLRWLAIRLALVIRLVAGIALQRVQDRCARLGHPSLDLHGPAERALRRMRGRAPPAILLPI